MHFRFFHFLALAAGTFCFSSPSLLNAQIIRSAPAGGNWSDAATWVGGVVPAASNSSHIIILSNVSVNGDLYSSATPLTVDQLEISSGGVTVAEHAGLQIEGVASIAAAAALQSFGVLFINNNLSVSGSLTSEATTTIGNSCTMTGAGSKIFHDIVVNGTFTPNAVYSLTGKLTIAASGVLLAGANTTVVQGIGCSVENAGTAVAAFNNLTVSEGSRVTVSSFFTTNGTLQISGTLQAEAGFHAFGDVNVAVDTGIAIVHDAPFEIDGVLTVSSGAAFSADANSDAYIHGNISASGDLTLASTLWIDRNTTMTGGGTKLLQNVLVSGNFKPNASMSILGNLTLTGSGSMPEGTSTTTFAGLNSVYDNQGSGEAVFHNILVAADTQFRNQTPLSCDGTFRSSGTFTAAANVTITGTCTISRGGFFYTAGADEIIIRNNFAISGTLNATCLFQFPGNTTITGAGSKNFQDIIISGTFTSFSGSMTIIGDLTLNGMFRHNNGTLVFTGENEKIIHSTNDVQSITFNNVTLQGGNAPVDLNCEMNTNIGGVLTLSTINGAARMDVDGLSNNRTFTLLSVNDDPTGDASIAALASDAIVSGVVNVQRFMSGEGRIYRYISSPMQGPGATVASWKRSFPITGNFADPSNPGRICNKTVQPQNPSLFYYDEVLKAYAGFPSSGLAENSPLVSGLGYAAYIRACVDSTLITVAGELQPGINRGNVSLPVSHTAPVASFNNLLGNPYPSALDWDFAQLTNISPTIAIRDNAAGVFRYYTKGGLAPAEIPHRVIAQGQAFWVRTTGIHPILSFDESAKAAGSASAGNVFYRASMPDALLVSLVNETGDEIDKTHLLLSKDASNSRQLDLLDAPKLNNQRDDPYEELVDLYTMAEPGGIPLAVNAVASLVHETPIPLVARDIGAGAYGFRITGSGVFNEAVWTVYDHYQQKALDGNDGLFRFTVTDDSLSKSPTRFELIFQRETITGLMELPDDTSVFPNPTRGTVWIETNPSTASPIEILDVNGVARAFVPLNKEGNLTSGCFDFQNFASGIYLLRIKTGEHTKLVRVVRE